MSLKAEEIYPSVGITILIFRDDKVLLGKRKGSHAAGEWAFPGGSMEYMESIRETVHREVKEETNMIVGEPEFVRLYNHREYSPKHFIDIAVRVPWVAGDPIVREPEKCEGWEWFTLDNLPNPLFVGIESVLEALKVGKIYFDPEN